MNYSLIIFYFNLCFFQNKIYKLLILYFMKKNIKLKKLKLLRLKSKDQNVKKKILIKKLEQKVKTKKLILYKDIIQKMNLILFNHDYVFHKIYYY